MAEIYIDGASAGHPGISGAGVFIKYEDQVFSYDFKLDLMTNNEAEFHALIKALEICVKENYSIVQIKSDSTTVVQAVEKRHTKNENHRKLLHIALQLIDQLDLFFIDWIPSKQNRAADHLARHAILKQKKKNSKKQ